MAKKETVCSCGASYDANGICTGCGKKKPRSAGYRILHGFLCILGTLLLTGCISRTMLLHDELQTTATTDAMRESRLSDASVPFQGTVASIIMRDYVDDPNVLESDVADAVDSMNITGFAADRMQTHFDMLRGTSDEPVQIQPEEIGALLTDNREYLYEHCKLKIEDADIDAVIQETTAPLNILNGISYFFGSSKAGRAIARFGTGIPALVLELVLLGLLLWRWMVVRRNAGKQKTGALRGMGRTILIPSAILALTALVLGIGSLFAKDEVVGLYPLIRATAVPYGIQFGLQAAAGLLMLAIGKFIPVHMQYKAMQPAKPKQQEAVPAVMPDAPLPERAETAAQPTAAAPVPAAAPAKAADGPTKTCISCGRDIKEAAKFCIYCGTNQATGKNVADEILEMPDPVDVPDLTALPDDTDT